MKAAKLIFLIMISSIAYSRAQATLFQSTWYTSYSPASGSTADFHNIGFSFSTTSKAFAQTGVTPLVSVLNDNEEANKVVIGAATAAKASDKRLKNYLPLIAGANIKKRIYVMYDINKEACVAGEQQYFTAKLRYFSCISAANTFADSLSNVNLLLHNGDSFVDDKSKVKSDGAFADVSTLKATVLGSDTTTCPSLR